jgi:DivIVA domain-containing protein
MRKKKSEPEETGLFPEEHQPARLMPVDVQQKEFRIAFRGYREAEVDEFLDLVTEELGRLQEETARLREENRRLQDGVHMAPTSPFAGGADLADAHRTADDIVSRAREQAETILREAEARAPSDHSGPATVAGAGAGTLSPFLAREREFLQGMATLIQGHAEFVKSTARSVRSSAPPAQPAVRPQPADTLKPPSTQEREAIDEVTAVDLSPWRAAGPDEESTAQSEPAAEMGEPEEREEPERVEGPDQAGPPRFGERAAGPGSGGGTPTNQTTQVRRNPFEESEEASSLDEPRAVSSSLDSGDGPESREEHPREERSVRELFWGEE